MIIQKSAPALIAKSLRHKDNNNTNSQLDYWMPAGCSLKLSMTTCSGAISLFTQVVYFFIPLSFFPEAHKSRTPSDAVSPQGSVGSKREAQSACPLMRTLKLMYPFASSKVDLKKSEIHSKGPSHCPAADQSLSSAQLCSIPFRFSSILNASCAQILLRAGGLSDCHTCVHSDSVPCAEN